MNDDHVIDLLRAAGTGGGDSDLGPAMRKGARMRRRRQIGQAVGGSAGLAAIVAMGIFVTGINSSSTVVVAPPAASSAPVVASDKTLTWAQTEDANIQLMLDVLGAGWGHGSLSSERTVELDPDSAAADGLPDGFAVFASMRVIDAATFALPCGIDCKDYTLADGRAVRVGKTWEAIRRSGNGEEPAGTQLSRGRPDSITAVYRRSNGGYVTSQIRVAQAGTSSTPEAQQAAIDFLDAWTDEIAGLAADDNVRPRVGEELKPIQAGPTKDEVHQLYLQEALGDDWGTKVDSERRITLKPESEKAAELPSSDYQGKATLQILSKAQFDAACNAKPGVEACNWQKLGDGTKVHWRAWADREASDDTMLGELAAYYPGEDGSVVMAMVSVLGREVSAAERDAHRDATFTWLESLRHQLIAATLDKRVGADVFTTD